MTQVEFDALSADPTRIIEGDVAWTEDEDHSLCVEFRRDIRSQSNYPLFVQGSYNRTIGKLRYSVIHRGAGRIYGLCMGSDHHNPVCTNVGGDRHLHIWNDISKDKDAVVAAHIIANADDPVVVWQQFCAGWDILHQGIMAQPPMILLPLIGGF
jgi:hypothetical protein